jgi:tRNA nucleotidyltransferase/poly(A) polymerase
LDILSGFNDEELYIVNSIERICRIKDIKSYVVGGAVRDILLHVNVKDIDICLNEDPIVVLKSLGGVHKFKYYDEFQTASIIFNNGISIDLIRCRKEVYLKPGMLPKIIPSDIKDDLYRRDFYCKCIGI